MSIISSEPKRTTADILRDHLARAGLSQRSGARALRVDDRTMRRYCSGDLDIPVPVLMAARQLPLLDRNMEVIRRLDSGRLSTGDGRLTKERLLENNKKLRRAIDYLIGRIDRI
jgi:plasmid maintenance system antidote protein VapI